MAIVNDARFTLVCIILLLAPLPPGVESFQSISLRTIHRSDTCLLAKKPPKALFDLKAIEDFELRLEEATKANEDDLDDDDDLFEVTASSEALSFTIPAHLHNKRIDAAIVELQPQLSRSTCASMINDGLVWVLDHDNRRVPVNRKSFKVEEGQTLRLLLPSSDAANITSIEPEDLPLDIVYEDEHMIVINKAAGMVVHPAVGHWNGTVCNALAHYLSRSSPFGPGEFANNSTIAKETAFRPGIVHRIDKGTTGLLVVAKTSDALATLSQSFKDRRVKKTYLAITVGNPGSNVKIDKPIARHPVFRQRMRVVPDPHRSSSSQSRALGAAEPKGRKAVSFVDTVAFNGKLALVLVRIVTGRTHQVRVHLQDRKTPIYGDTVYGLADWNKKLYKSHQLDRPLLHAYKLELEHPVTGESMKFEAPLPEDMARIAKTVDDTFEAALSQQQ